MTGGRPSWRNGNHHIKMRTCWLMMRYHWDTWSFSHVPNFGPACTGFCCPTDLQFCSRTFFGNVCIYFCHPHPLFVLSTVPLCKDIQIPHEFRVEIDDVCTKCLLKQTLSHSSSVLKLMLVDGPSWHNNFGDGALNRFFPRQKRFFPIQKHFYPYPSFG